MHSFYVFILGMNQLGDNEKKKDEVGKNRLATMENL